MRRLRNPLGVLLITSGLWGCATAPAVLDPVPVAARITAIAFSADGSRLLAARESDGACSLLELDPVTAAELDSRPLARCPLSISPLQDGSLVLYTGEGGLPQPGSEPAVIAGAASGDNLVLMESAAHVWVRRGERLVLPENLRNIRVLDKAGALLAVQKEGGSETLVRVDDKGTVTRLIPEGLDRIDSYDVSPDQKEFVLSARRSASFDVALGSTASPSIRWVATDPLDEVMVSWAPRGSKVTFLVRGRDGSLLQSLHVPTGYSLTVDLPQTEVSALAWEPRAERFAIAASTPASSSHIQILAYGGEGRRVLLEPERQGQDELEPLLWTGGSAWMSRPSKISYGASYPIVIWTGVNSPFEWSDLRAWSRTRSENLSVLVSGGMEVLTPQFWDALAANSWADLSRVTVVDPSPSGQATLPAGVRVIAPEELRELERARGGSRSR